MFNQRRNSSTAGLRRGHDNSILRRVVCWIFLTLLLPSYNNKHGAGIGFLKFVDGLSRCGEPLTEDCDNSPNDVKKVNERNFHLTVQSNIWRQRNGYYRVEGYDYFDDYLGDIEMDQTRIWDGFPYHGFVNITVRGTRVYYHGYFIQPNLVNRIGRAWYREWFGHSQDPTPPIPSSSYTNSTIADRTARMGNAYLLDERIEGTKDDVFHYPNGIVIQAEESVIRDIGNGRSVRQTISRVPNDETDQLIFLETLECVPQRGPGKDCVQLNFLEERFDSDGNRLSFTSGIYTKIPSEQEWIQAINTEYEAENIPEVDRRSVPNDCLVTGFCITEKEWCDHGDPSCEFPLEAFPENGDITTGSVASIIVFGTIFLMIFLWIGWNMYNSMVERRYRTHFITRFAQDVSLQKPMKEITPENMSREFNFIDKEGKGHITKGELLNFLLSLKLAPKLPNKRTNNFNTKPKKIISDRDFTALWQKIDLNRAGQVGYAEFCAFTADCYQEHSILRNELLIQCRKNTRMSTTAVNE